MSEVQANDPFSTLLEDWLQAEPESHGLRMFVPQARTPVGAALLVFAHQVEVAALGSDPRPGQAKLAWWLEEIGEAAQGRARHPVSVRLVAHSDQGAVLWPALARWTRAAVALLEWHSVARYEDLVAGMHGFADAAVHAYAAAGLAPAPGAADTDMEARATLVRGLRRFPRWAGGERSLAPLDLLLAAGVERAALSSDRDGHATAAVLSSLATRLAAELAQSGPIRRGLLSSRHHLAWRLARDWAGQPQAALRALPPPLTLGTVVGLWRRRGVPQGRASNGQHEDT